MQGVTPMKEITEIQITVPTSPYSNTPDIVGKKPTSRAVSRNRGPRCETQNEALKFKILNDIATKNTFTLLRNFNMCYF